MRQKIDRYGPLARLGAEFVHQPDCRKPESVDCRAPWSARCRPKGCRQADPAPISWQRPLPTFKFNPSRSPTATVFASAWYERSACRLQHSGKVRAQMFAHRRHVRSLVAGQVRCRRPGCREIKLSRRVSSRPSSGESPLRQRAVEQLRFCAPWKAR